MASTASAAGAGPSAAVTYFVEVDGPDGVGVPLHLLANFSSAVSSPSTGVAFAGILLQGVNVGESLSLGGNGFETCAGEDCSDGQCLARCLAITNLLNLDTSFYVESDVPIEVTLFARCAVPARGSCSANADPMFSIDPTFLSDNPDFSLEFSAGIVNTLGVPPGGVPEPATWAMMLVGFAGIGWTLRRRGRRAVAAA